eukprot:1152853-Pelagomonas_calceolata.AAC.2
MARRFNLSQMLCKLLGAAASPSGHSNAAKDRGGAHALLTWRRTLHYAPNACGPAAQAMATRISHGASIPGQNEAHKNITSWQQHKQW